MLKRTISGAVFVLIIAGCFVLRQQVDYRLFYLLLALFSSIGTFEVARALKKHFAPISITVCTIFGILFVPSFVIFEHFYVGYGIIGATAILVLAFIVTSIANVKLGVKACLGVLVPLLYPSMLLLFQMLANTCSLGFEILILTYVVSPFTDTFAYLIGLAYNKIRGGKAKKLCPNLSPKKTIAGAIGGLFGGVLGALLAFVVFGTGIQPNAILFYIVAGVIASIFTQVGDLFESYIKRKVKIKDIGKIMPGHGGVMDRIDGISFSGVVLFLMFLLV